MTDALTTTEQDELDSCERIIRAGIGTFVEVGNALMTIHDKRLYRARHATFADYCRSTYPQMTRQRAYQLMNAANMTTIVDKPIPNEAVARALTKVHQADLGPVYDLAYEAAEGKPDAGYVRAAAEVYEDMKATGGKVDDGDGGMVEAHRAVVENRLERMKRQRQHVREATERKNGREHDRPVEGDVMVIATDERRGFVTIQCPELARLVGQGEKVYAIFYIKEVKHETQR